MQIKPIDKPQVAEAVYEQMLAMILSGTFKPDTKLPSENVLREEFNVSRHTIRTVLNRFYALGLIETVPGDGTYLRNPGNMVYTNSLIPAIAFQINDVFEVMEYRAGLESESALLCAQRATDEELVQLREELMLLETLADDPEGFAIHDIDFHVMIAQASKNSILFESMKIVRTLQNATISSFISKTEYGKSQNEHRLVLQALEERDPEKAAVLMREHITNANLRFKEVGGPGGV